MLWPKRIIRGRELALCSILELQAHLLASHQSSLGCDGFSCPAGASRQWTNVVASIRDGHDRVLGHPGARLSKQASHDHFETTLYTGGAGHSTSRTLQEVA